MKDNTYIISKISIRVTLSIFEYLHEKKYISWHSFIYKKKKRYSGSHPSSFFFFLLNWLSQIFTKIKILYYKILNFYNEKNILYFWYVRIMVLIYHPRKRSFIKIVFFRYRKKLSFSNIKGVNRIFLYERPTFMVNCANQTQNVHTVTFAENNVQLENSFHDMPW